MEEYRKIERPFSAGFRTTGEKRTRRLPPLITSFKKKRKINTNNTTFPFTSVLIWLIQVVVQCLITRLNLSLCLFEGAKFWAFVPHSFICFGFVCARHGCVSRRSSYLLKCLFKCSPAQATLISLRAWYSVRARVAVNVSRQHAERQHAALVEVRFDRSLELRRPQASRCIF